MELRVKEYVAGSGRLGDDDAKRIGTHLEKRFGDEPITARMVVNEARPKRSPLHGDFEWDDSIAGEQYRLEQARKILRAIEVVFTNGEDRPKTRAYHQVVVTTPEGQQRAYVPAKVVWGDVDLAAQVRAKALAELRGWAERFRQYETLSGLVESVDQLLLEVAS